MNVIWLKTVGNMMGNLRNEIQVIVGKDNEPGAMSKDSTMSHQIIRYRKAIGFLREWRHQSLNGYE